MKRALVALALVLGSGAALGQFQSGDALYKRMQSTAGSPEGRIDLTFVNGYVAGVADAAGPGALYCIPGVKVSQVVDVVARDLAEHPESRHKDAAVLVMLALVRTWPCPTPKPRER